MKKSIVLTILFVLCISLFFVIMISTPDKEYSQSERRLLAQFPKVDNIVESGMFLQDFEKYSADQFPFREQFRSLKALFSKHVFHKLDNNDLFVAENHISKIDKEANDKMIDYASSLFKKVYDAYLKDNNTKVYLSIVPDKNYFIAEKNNFPSMDYDSFINKVITKNDYMKYIDIIPLLSAEDYYYTDTHWKQENIIDVSEKLITNMQGNFIGTEYKENVLNRPFEGVYKGQLALPFENDTIKYLTSNTLDVTTTVYYDTGKPKPGDIYNMKKAYDKDAYEIFLSGVAPLITINNNKALNDKKLILFRDSFGSSLAPLLVENYSEITIVDLRYMQSSLLGNFIDFSDADVLFLYSTSILNNSMSMR